MMERGYYVWSSRIVCSRVWHDGSIEFITETAKFWYRDKIKGTVVSEKS